MCRRIALFLEDNAHEQVIGALVRRIAEENKVKVRLEYRNATGGRSMVMQSFRNFLRNLERQKAPWPDLLVVATDTNCKGISERADEFKVVETPFPVILALPDPHIERWLLLDGHAFRQVFGKGCQAPDHKCERLRYKEKLRVAIRATGIEALLGGTEYAEDIVRNMNLSQVASMDKSFGRFLSELKNVIRRW